jgi:outer membrane protein TolC
LSSGVSRSGDDWKAERESWRLGVQLSIPIFSGGGRDFVNTRMTRIKETIAGENLRQTRHRLGTEIHSAWVDLINARDNLDVRRKYLEASAEQSRIITTKYLNGLISYLEWNRVENEYISAQRSLLNAHRDVALALARWLRTLGRVEEEELLPNAVIGNP